MTEVSSLQQEINEDIDTRIDISQYKTQRIEVLVKNTDGVVCIRCKSDNINVIQKQLRSADEGATNIYKCLDCGYTWRRNN